MDKGIIMNKTTSVYIEDFGDIEYKNSRYNIHGSIDVDINHPQLGWITFHATPDDEETHGRELFEKLKDISVSYEPES